MSRTMEEVQNDAQRIIRRETQADVKVSFVMGDWCAEGSAAEVAKVAAWAKFLNLGLIYDPTLPESDPELGDWNFARVQFPDA